MTKIELGKSALVTVHTFLRLIRGIHSVGKGSSKQSGPWTQPLLELPRHNHSNILDSLTLPPF